MEFGVERLQVRLAMVRGLAGQIPALSAKADAIGRLACLLVDGAGWSMYEREQEDHWVLVHSLLRLEPEVFASRLPKVAYRSGAAIAFAVTNPRPTAFPAHCATLEPFLARMQLMENFGPAITCRIVMAQAAERLMMIHREMGAEPFTESELNAVVGLVQILQQVPPHA